MIPLKPYFKVMMSVYCKNDARMSSDNSDKRCLCATNVDAETDVKRVLNVQLTAEYMQLDSFLAASQHPVIAAVQPQ